jgi:hypothetical protein
MFFKVSALNFVRKQIGGKCLKGYKINYIKNIASRLSSTEQENGFFPLYHFMNQQKNQIISMNFIDDTVSPRLLCPGAKSQI